MAGFDANLLVPVGPGTLTSRLMREYWLPAAKSTELVPGGAPLRVLILGEKLLAFRSASGEIGLIDHVCPHRGASLFYGRNEGDGMRCAYHGWKFDRSGTCVDTPNVPAGRPRPKIKTTAYRTCEANGMVWVYMGERAVPPPLPIFAHHDLEAVFIVRDCNWLQALEGDIDTSHVGFLHLGGMEAEDLPAGHPSRIRLRDRAPEFEVVQTAWGNMSGAYRDLGDNERYWSLAHFLFPCWTITANDMPFSMPWLARGWVPLDDTHTLLITLLDKNFALPPGLTDKGGNPIPGTSFSWGTPVPNTSDWLGRWRIEENLANDHLINRDLQRISALVGVEGITPQDQAITESQGAIQDRSLEHLVPSDAMIVRTRRLIQRSAEQWVEQGIVPPGVDNPGAYYGARGGVLPCAGKEDFVGVYTRAAERTATFTRAYADTQAPSPEAAPLDA